MDTFELLKLDSAALGRSDSDSGLGFRAGCDSEFARTSVGRWVERLTAPVTGTLPTYEAILTRPELERSFVSGRGRLKLRLDNFLAVESLYSDVRVSTFCIEARFLHPLLAHMKGSRAR